MTNSSNSTKIQWVLPRILKIYVYTPPPPTRTHTQKPQPKHHFMSMPCQIRLSIRSVLYLGMTVCCEKTTDNSHYMQKAKSALHQNVSTYLWLGWFCILKNGNTSSPRTINKYICLVLESWNAEPVSFLILCASNHPSPIPPLLKIHF